MARPDYIGIAISMGINPFDAGDILLDVAEMLTEDNLANVHEITLEAFRRFLEERDAD